QVQRLGGAEAQRGQIKPLQQVQLLEHQQPLRRRARLIYLHAAVGDVDRLIHLGLVGGEVVAGEQATERAGEINELRRNLAAVERLGAAIGEATQRPCVVGPAQQRP